MTAPLPDEPEILAYLAQVDALYPARAGGASVAERRQIYEAMCQAFAAPHPDGVTASDGSVADGGRNIPIRTYRPSSGGAPGTIMWIHGGGFVVGSLASHDSICADICGATSTPVVAVDYRLAPEHTGLDDHEDCWAVFRRIADQDGPIAVAGDSAGANLAAGLALRARDDGRTYAARLAGAGVNVTFREEPQMVHAWLRARHLSPGARSAFDALCAALSRMVAR